MANRFVIGDPNVDLIIKADSNYIQSWNNKIKEKDTVYILGSFTASKSIEIIKELNSKLNGFKTIIIDKKNDPLEAHDYTQCGFEAACYDPLMLNTNLVIMYEPPYVTEYGCDIWFRMDYLFGHRTKDKVEADNYGNCVCVSAKMLKDNLPVDIDAILPFIDPASGSKLGD